MANPNPTPSTKSEQETPTAARETRYLVKEEAKIPRGASHYTLTKGKIISNLGYDIAALKNQGVKLEEVREP